MAWHAVEVPEAPPIIASTLAGLGSGVMNGQPGIVRLGTYPDDYELRLRWNVEAGRWVAPEIAIMSTNDAWAVDGINHQPPDFKNQWYRPMHGVGWYHGTRAVLNANRAASATANIVVKNVADGPFDAAGKIMIRGWTPSYTSYSDTGGGTFTFGGVTNGPTEALVGDVVPIIPYDNAKAADGGGWGITTQHLDYAEDLWTAGFRLEERVALVYMCGSQDEQAMTAGVHWFEYDQTTDLFVNPAPWVEPADDDTYLGAGIAVTGPTDHYAGFDGGGTRVQERGFEIRYTGWTVWSAGAPTKRYLRPLLYCKMPTGANDTGELYGLTVEARWVGEPA